jgi:hypothetical protein
MLVKLKAALARHPLAGFFALTGAACVVYVGLVAAASPMFANEWANRFSMVSAMAAGLAALVCCWAISGPRSWPSRRFTQLCIVVAVVLVTMTALCVEVWLQWRMERGLFAGVGGSPGVHVMPMPSLGSWIHRELGSTLPWLRALVAGLVLAGVASPFTAVRRLARALVSWRGRRVWLLVAVALLVPGVCVAAARIGGSLAPLAVDGFVSVHYSASYSVAAFVTALLINVPLVFAWYGFVGERLARRASPLVAGLVIGLALVLPSQLAVRIVDRSVGLSGLNYAWYDLTLMGAIAVAVLAVWLVRKARGSLVPTVVLIAAVSTGANYVTWTSLNYGILVRARELYPACLIVVAVSFALAGRMWRRTEAPPSPLTFDESSPLHRGYDVVVKDLGMAE